MKRLAPVALLALAVGCSAAQVATCRAPHPCPPPSPPPRDAEYSCTLRQASPCCMACQRMHQSESIISRIILSQSRRQKGEPEPKRPSRRR